MTPARTRNRLDETTQLKGRLTVMAYANIIRGLYRALRLYKGLLHKYGPVEQILHRTWIDGLPGYVSLYGGTLQTTTFEIEDGQITAIYMARNPDKLQHVPLTGSEMWH